MNPKEILEENGTDWSERYVVSDRYDVAEIARVPVMLSELVSVLVGLRTYQHPGTLIRGLSATGPRGDKKCGERSQIGKLPVDDCVRIVQRIHY